jgi:hypothetical protein
MFEKAYDQVVCKNIGELIYVNSVASNKLHKKELSSTFIMKSKYPVNLFLHGDGVGWTDLQDRIGDKNSFLDFVLWEQGLTSATASSDSTG